uniref:PAS domain-containing protein n=2 Tax=Brevundimonas TaxID=41275 RepID=UPI0028ABAA5B
MKQQDDWRLTDVVEHEIGRGDPFAAAIRGTRMPMVITDPRRDDNPIVFANKAFQDLTGYERDEIIGQNCRFLQGPDSDRDAVAKIRDALQAGTDIHIDLLNYRKDGSTFWNALFISPVRNAHGDIEYFFASQLDVTERIEAQAYVEKQKALVEREVAARTADLQEALAAKTLLLHEVDHRVKNNLTMIGSLLRLQSRSLSDPALTATLD